jgi:acyl-CoA thioesterase-1
MTSRLSLLVFSIFFFIATPALSINILCLGDSLTEGYGVAKSDAWPAVTEAILRAKKMDVTMVNAGVSGSTSASAQSRLRWHLKSKVKFDWMILALGANDGLRGQPVKGIKQNLQSAVEAARTAGIKKIILAGIRVPPNYGKNYSADFFALYPELAKNMKLPLIPFLLEGVAANPELNLPDGIHPNAKGHKIVAQNVAKFIESNL